MLCFTTPSGPVLVELSSVLYIEARTNGTEGSRIIFPIHSLYVCEFLEEIAHSAGTRPGLRSRMRSLMGRGNY
jgi:hypothetical protein